MILDMVAGTYALVVEDNQSGLASQPYPFTILPSDVTPLGQQAIVYLSGTSFNVGDKITMGWSASFGAKAPILTLMNAEGQVGNPINTGAPGDSYVWTIPSGIQPGTYYIEISNGLNEPASSTNFHYS